MRKPSSFLIVLALAIASSCRSAFCWDNILTHGILIDKGEQLLRQDAGPYLEMASPEYSERMKDGSEKEDGGGPVPGYRGMWHFFYPPVAPHGLSGSFLLGFGCPEGTCDDARDTGADLWKDAIDTYKTSASSRGDAYFKLGRAVHILAQDIALPSHVHNDPHLGPEHGGDNDPVDDYAHSKTISQFPDGTRVEPIDSDNPRLGAWWLALATFKSSEFQGSLDLALRIGEIRIDQKVYVPKYIRKKRFLATKCLDVEHWEIEVPGAEKPLCFNPNTSFDRGSAADNDWWEETRPMLEGSVTRYYMERAEHFEIDSQTGLKTLSAHFFDTQIPQAINYTAGLMKLFAQTVDQVPPTLDVRHLDGTPVDWGTFSGGSLRVTAKDSPDTAGKYPVPSGIYLLQLEDLQGNPISPPPHHRRFRED